MNESERKTVNDIMRMLRRNPWLKSQIRREIPGEDLKAMRRRIRDLPLATRAFIIRSTSGLSGTKYEKQAATDGCKILRDRLQLLEVELSFQPGGQGDKEMDYPITSTRESGTITQGEEAELRSTGLIYTGMGYTKSIESGRFITAEVETTITPIHVEKARTRRNILQKATAYPIIAAVIGIKITPEARAILRNDVIPVGMDANGKPTSMASMHNQKA